MRPSPSDVVGWFASDLTDEVLDARLIVLRRDPNWSVTDFVDSRSRTLRLLYYPHGIPFDVVLRRTPDGWSMASMTR